MTSLQFIKKKSLKAVISTISAPSLVRDLRRSWLQKHSERSPQSSRASDGTKEPLTLGFSKVAAVLGSRNLNSRPVFPGVTTADLKHQPIAYFHIMSTVFDATMEKYCRQKKKPNTHFLALSLRPNDTTPTALRVEWFPPQTPDNLLLMWKRD